MTLPNVIRALDWYVFGVDRRRPRAPRVPGPDTFATELEQGVEDLLMSDPMDAPIVIPPTPQRRRGDPDSNYDGPDWRHYAPRWLLVIMVCFLGGYYAYNDKRRTDRIEEHINANTDMILRIATLETKSREHDDFIRIIKERQEGVLQREQKRDAQYEEILHRLAIIERATRKN